MSRKVEKEDYIDYKNRIDFSCSVCYEPLKIGDQLDSTYPWQAHNNRCEKCLKTEKKKEAVEDVIEIVKKSMDEKGLRLRLENFFENLEI